MARPPSVESIFIEAIDLPDDERVAFLDQRCAGDPDLRAAVDALIHADRQAGQGEFLESNLLGGDSAHADTANSNDSSSNGEGVDESLSDAPQGRFRIMGAYREGGLGEVLIAHDRQLDRDVAVKQIKPRWKENLEARQRFVQEAKVTGRLEHPGIVPVYAMGTWPDGGHYYAMRFIEGDTMKDAIEKYHHLCDDVDRRDECQMQLRELLSRFIDVCQTIHYAHSKRVLHRDIKPSNIMVGPYGETLVVDWGLAKLLDEPAEDSMTADLARALAEGSGSTPTQVGGTIGTPQYMSPEQARGKLDEIGVRTDVYLLGATLYQILTGRPPHSGSSISELLKQIGQGRLTRPREIRLEIAPPLQSICLKAMATDPADRYSNASQIADDINRWLADQPVSVHGDSVIIRVNRWMRRHKTATSTIAVATLLIAIGAVVGSILWNVAQVRQLQAEEESLEKELELRLKDRQRIGELALAATTAEQLAQKELSRSRFSSAYDVLINAMESIKSEDALVEQADRIQVKVDRVGALVDFYRLAEVCEEQNILSRDTKALMACTQALKKLGVWDRADWWETLPDQDLSPGQQDRLCWDVYQQMMLMDAMLIKTIGVRLSGDGRVGGFAMLRAAGRLLTTDAGKREAEAALVVSDRLDRFRKSESSRFYRSLADLRLGTGNRLLGRDLGLPTNGPDAHSLAVMSMIASIDPSFGTVFREYYNDDPLLASRDLFERAASLNPRYYNAHLGLGQVEYLLAKRNGKPNWEDLAPSLRAFGQCITLLPERCFAYADRSSIYRSQALLILQDERYDEDEREQRAQERLQWSLADAEQAMQFYQEHPWVGWQSGQSFAEVGQSDRATDLWIRTGIDVYPLGQIADSEIVAVDDLRGRAEIGDWLEERLMQPDYRWSRARAFVALAAVRLNQNRVDDALDASESALEIDELDPDARAIRAMALLRAEAAATAATEFRSVIESHPDHPLAVFGMALCEEKAGNHQQAASLYRRAEQAVTTAENQSAAALGVGRTAALIGDLKTADVAIRRAISLEPACDLLDAVRPMAVVLKQWRDSGGADESRIDELATFIRSLSTLPRATRIELMPAADLDKPSSASLLNGDFELGSMKYWVAPSGAHWETVAGAANAAETDRSQSHSGKWSLRIDSEAGGGAFGRTGQTFSIVAGIPYQLSCWVKAENLAEGACRIETGHGQVVIELESGTYDWRRVTGTVRIDRGPRGEPLQTGTVIGQRLEIIASGSGTAWLDDLTCRHVAEGDPGESGL